MKRLTFVTIFLVDLAQQLLAQKLKAEAKQSLTWISTTGNTLQFGTVQFCVEIRGSLVEEINHQN